MLRYECKKIFSRSKNRIAVLVMAAVLAVTSILTINRVEYVDENGQNSTGITAAAKLRTTKNEWAGYLTEEVLQKALTENNRINQSAEAQSEDITEQDKAYAKKQGFVDIIDVISNAFSEYRNYDYFAANHVSVEDAGAVYERRIDVLKDWLDSGEETYTQGEKDFLIHQYETLGTPFYYEYADGWKALLQNISTVLLILALIIGFLIAGIFSDEFLTRADAIFFSSKLGRGRAILSKIAAGLLTATVFYFVFTLLYTCIVLAVLGADGAGCPIQLDMWRSSYNITYFQAYLFIVTGGYIAVLLSSVLAMLVSALSHSTTVAVMVPFILLCAFPFLSRIITLPGLCSLFPDQLLQIYVDLRESSLFDLAGRVVTAPMVMIPVYTVISLLFLPVLYHAYKRTEAR